MKFHVAPCVLPAVVLWATQVCAESEQGKPAQTFDLDMMTVTAQKIEQDSIEVPISVTVMDEFDIEDRNIDSLGDVTRYTPGFTLYDGGSAGVNTVVTRGINASVTSFTTSTGLYVDGVPVSNAFGFDVVLEDVERIEVLRGPQSTLYGRDAQAGAVNIITRKPGNETTASVYGMLADEGRGKAGFSVSGALIEDTLFLGLSGRHTEKDGYIENVSTGEMVNEQENDYGKAVLRYTPFDDLEIIYTGSVFKADNGMQDWARNGGPRLEVDPNLDGGIELNTVMHSLSVDYALGPDSHLKSITARRIHDDDTLQDFDLSQATLRHLERNYRFRNLTQEFRYEGKIGEHSLVAGIDAHRNDDDRNLEITNPMGVFRVEEDVDGHGYGLFSHLNYRLTPRFSLDTGLRFDRETKGLKVATGNLDVEETWRHISPKIGLTYRLDSKSAIYVVYAEGYRSGGFNTAAPAGARVYDEELIDSYEIGYKGLLFDDRLRLNASLYYMKIDDMQVQEFQSVGTGYTTNAAEATSRGIELDFQAYLTDEIVGYGSLGINNTEFDRFSDFAGDYAGNANPLAPDYNFNLGLQYRDAKGYFAQLEWYGLGKTYLDKANSNTRDAYSLIDIKVGYETDRFDVYGYVTNLTDKEYDSNGAYTGEIDVISPPREIGAQLTYRF